MFHLYGSLSAVEKCNSNRACVCVVHVLCGVFVFEATCELKWIDTYDAQSVERRPSHLANGSKVPNTYSHKIAHKSIKLTEKKEKGNCRNDPTSKIENIYI